MTLVLDKKVAEERFSETKQETDGVVKSALQGAIASGRIGNLQVDPSYLQFETLLGNYYLFTQSKLQLIMMNRLKIRCGISGFFGSE